jgi:hypothetical protein
LKPDDDEGPRTAEARDLVGEALAEGHVGAEDFVDVFGDELALHEAVDEATFGVAEIVQTFGEPVLGDVFVSRFVSGHRGLLA